MTENDILIGELSRRTGCNIETIRYYERIDLIPKPIRIGRYRAYGDLEVKRLRFVRRARELGFTLAEVKTLLQLSASGPAACAKARELAASNLDAVRGRISDLRQMERVLSRTVRACDRGHDATCPLIDTLSADKPRGGG
ncbi:MAG: helix-turn-helix domain-containing protein [Rhodospirillaceae bacterium]|nr:helix-turn-helix domain-containing protein [Rhodospirillaceae bacterium]